jgi:hypothetical protein
MSRKIPQKAERGLKAVEFIDENGGGPGGAATKEAAEEELGPLWKR